MASTLFLCASAQSEITVPENAAHAWHAPLAQQSLLLAIGSSSSATLVVGERGHILKKSPTGDWHQSLVPSQNLLTSVSVLDDGNAWAVGHDTVILHSADGGVNWAKQYEAAELEQPLLDVYFMSDKQGIAIGAYGLYLHTEDGGKSWQSKLVNEQHDYHLNAIDVSDDGTIYIAAEAGYVYRSEDNGATWKTLSPDYSGSFFSVTALPGGKVVVSGLRGRMFMSLDRGNNWKEIATDSSVSLDSVIRLRNGQLAVAGHGGVLLLEDHERGQVYKYQFADRKALSDLAEMDANQLLLVGEAGVKQVNLCQLFKRDQIKGCGN